MPNIKSAKKRVKVTEVKTLQNKNNAARKKSQFTKLLNGLA